jgi:phosphatidylinositol kinase/protein kinase (PI-3  family)
VISLVDKIFKREKLRLWLRPYAIVCCGHEAGLIECLTDAKSIDDIKKRTPNFKNMEVTVTTDHYYYYF